MHSEISSTGGGQLANTDETYIRNWKSVQAKVRLGWREGLAGHYDLSLRTCWPGIGSVLSRASITRVTSTFWTTLRADRTRPSALSAGPHSPGAPMHPSGPQQALSFPYPAFLLPQKYRPSSITDIREIRLPENNLSLGFLLFNFCEMLLL